MSAALFDEWHGSPYVTCLIARIDVARRTLTYTNAGHPPGMLVRNGQNRELAEGGPPLGLLPCARYREEQLKLVAGDVCAFMTDGITEAIDNGVHRWRAVVLDAVREARSAPIVCSAIMSRAREGPGPDGVDDWTDDQTVVVVSIRK
jgi:sigma-B regulation protein RsbU (phosphoserine phosphatase)